MQITLTTDRGEVIDVIEKAEQFDLDRPLAIAALIGVIQDAIEYDKANKAKWENHVG